MLQISITILLQRAMDVCFETARILYWLKKTDYPSRLLRSTFINIRVEFASHTVLSLIFTLIKLKINVSVWVPVSENLLKFCGLLNLHPGIVVIYVINSRLLSRSALSIEPSHQFPKFRPPWSRKLELQCSSEGCGKITWYIWDI